MQPGVVRKTSAALIVPAVADSKDSPLQDADLLPCRPGLYLDSGEPRTRVFPGLVHGG